MQKSEFKLKVFIGFHLFLLINLDKRDRLVILSDVNCVLGVKNYMRYNTGAVLELSVLECSANSITSK